MLKLRLEGGPLGKHHNVLHEDVGDQYFFLWFDGQHHCWRRGEVEAGFAGPDLTVRVYHYVGPVSDEDVHDVDFVAWRDSSQSD